MSCNKLPIIPTLLMIFLESWENMLGHSSQRPLGYLIFCNYFWLTVSHSKADSANKPTVVSLRVKIGNKLNYGHRIKLYYCVMFATTMLCLDLCHLRDFCVAFVLSLCCRKILPRLFFFWYHYGTLFEISNCRYLRP